MKPDRMKRSWCLLFQAGLCRRLGDAVALGENPPELGEEKRPPKGQEACYDDAWADYLVAFAACLNGPDPHHCAAAAYEAYCDAIDECGE